MAAHWLALLWYMAPLAAIGHVAAAHHASADGRQRGVAIVHDVDAAISRRELLETAQPLASGRHVFGPTAVGEIVVEIAPVALRAVGRRIVTRIVVVVVAT